MENTTQAPKGAKFELTIEGLEGQEFKAYLKPINRVIMETALGLIMPISGTPKLITAGELILNACWLEGDDEIKKDEDLFCEACLQAVSLIERKNATLKKL